MSPTDLLVECPTCHRTHPANAGCDHRDESPRCEVAAPVGPSDEWEDRGLLRCSYCGLIVHPVRHSLRWTGRCWEHGHGQAGHHPCDWFGRGPAPTPAGSPVTTFQAAPSPIQWWVERAHRAEAECGRLRDGLARANYAARTAERERDAALAVLRRLRQAAVADRLDPTPQRLREWHAARDAADALLAAHPAPAKEE